MKSINISKYQRNCFSINFFYSLVSSLISCCIAVYSDVDMGLMSCVIILVLFATTLFYILSNTKFSLVSILGFTILSAIHFYFLLSRSANIWFIIISVLLIYFTCLSIISQKKLLKKWKRQIGIKHGFIDLKHDTGKTIKLEYKGESIKRKLFIIIFTPIILWSLLGYVVITYMSNYLVIKTLIILIPIIIHPVQYFIRNIEIKSIRKSGINVDLKKQKSIITVLRSHVFDSSQVSIKESNGFGEDSKKEFIKVILDSCVLPPAFLAITNDPDLCPRYIGASISNEKYWLEDIEKFIQKSPMIILILGKIYDNGKETGLKKEIELIDRYNLWCKTLLIIPPPIENHLASQLMWDEIKKNVGELKDINLFINNKSIGYMFSSNRQPILEFKANEKDENSYQDVTRIAASILL